MSCSVRVTLKGLPERVHAVADALDQAMPNTFDWQDLAGTGKGFEISVHGIGMLEPAQQTTILAASQLLPRSRSATTVGLTPSVASRRDTRPSVASSRDTRPSVASRRDTWR